MSTFRLHLYSSAPSTIADNEAWTLAAAVTFLLDRALTAGAGAAGALPERVDLTADAWAVRALVAGGEPASDGGSGDPGEGGGPRGRCGGDPAQAGHDVASAATGVSLDRKSVV